MTQRHSINVCIKINPNNHITDINSSVFIKDTSGWVIIDSGYGDKYAHAQTQYLGSPLTDENGRYKFAYINGVVHKII